MYRNGPAVGENLELGQWVFDAGKFLLQGCKRAPDLARRDAIVPQFLQSLERDQVGKRKAGDFRNQPLTLPAAQLLPGNSQHAADIFSRIILHGLNSEHAEILTCIRRVESLFAPLLEYHLKAS